MKPRPAKVTVNHAWKARWLACEHTASGAQLECLEDHWDYAAAGDPYMICFQCGTIFYVGML